MTFIQNQMAIKAGFLSKISKAKIKITNVNITFEAQVMQKRSILIATPL